MPTAAAKQLHVGHGTSEWAASEGEQKKRILRFAQDDSGGSEQILRATGQFEAVRRDQ
jgi:hypothetical protein